MRKIPFIIIFAILLPLFLGVVVPLFSTPETALAQTAPPIPDPDSTTYAADSAAYDAYLAATAAQQQNNPSKPFGLTCWSIVPPGFDMGSCVALAGYYIFWYPTAAVLMLAAAVFDTMAAWSFNADILGSGMVSSAWGMVRDIANLALIFALLYIANATILQIGGVQLKKAVANVIIVALLINFSFFVTRVVIDASNVLASSLYSRITANAAPGTGLGPTAIGSENIGVLQISSRIVSVFDVQKFLTEDVVKAWNTAGNGNSSLFFVFFFAAFVNVVAAYVFLKAGLLLVARVVMFVFLLISSPLAFAAWALPGGGGNFDKKWWSSLVDQALVAPVFFLFLYVITSVYSKNLIDGIVGTSVNKDFLPFLVNIALHFVIVVVALLIAVKVTTKLSGAAGSYATAVGGAVVGGAVLGGAAFAGRAVIGGTATRMAESERFKKLAAENPTIGRWSKAGLDAVSGASFDGRSIIGSGELGKPRKGGYTEDLKTRVEAKEKLAKHVGTDKFGKSIHEIHEGEDRVLLDRGGNPIYTVKSGGKIPIQNQKTGEIIKDKRTGETQYRTLKDRVADNFENSWARSSRQAAQKIKKEKPLSDKLKDVLKETGDLKEDVEKPEGVEAVLKETEKPKEA